MNKPESLKIHGSQANVRITWSEAGKPICQGDVKALIDEAKSGVLMDPMTVFVAWAIDYLGVKQEPD